MTLPVALRQALNTQLPEMQSPAMSAARNHQSELRMVPLRDSQGALQVIVRYSDLFDINELNIQLERDLRVVPAQEQAAMCQRLGVKSLPALPALTAWETLIDERVDELESVSIPYADDEPAMTLDRASFQRLTDNLPRRSFCVPLSELRVNFSQPGLDMDQLHSAVRRFTDRRISQRLEDTLEIPPLPETAKEILRIRVDPNSTTNDLVKVVESDPSLAAQVVSWASSSFYSMRGDVQSVQDAVFRVLGFDMVMNLAMALALGKTLKVPDDSPDGYISYWQQSVWVAQATSVLAAQIPADRRPSAGLSYLSGLLQNFGYLVMAHVFPPHFRQACRAWEVNQHLDTCYVEQHILGITREQLAATLMQNWNMPEAVCTAIRHQKSPASAPDNLVYAQLTGLARNLLVERGISVGAVPDSIPQLLAALELDEQSVSEAFDDLMEQAPSITNMAGILGR